jgi:two-component system nitrogen regulation response regulator GlnG
VSLPGQVLPPDPRTRSHGRTDTGSVPASDDGSVVLGVTLMWHPHAGRIGQRAVLAQPGGSLAINRFSPLFLDARGNGEPLGEPCVSRDPLHLNWEPDGQLVLQPSNGRMSCEVNGVPVSSPIALAPDALRAGVVVVLGGRVALCIHRIDVMPGGAGDGTLVGVSSAMARLRRQVAIAGASELPVLVLGETGTGKELVAQALHRASARASRPLLSVNMAALPQDLAAAELFGSVRGAYTGSQSTRRGLWSMAHESTLFMDEIGDTPHGVQPMLLRALETGEFRPLGATQTERADVRVIAATDRDLSSGFSRPLRHRLEGFVIHTTPLRQRREDIGVLAAHFLQSSFAAGDWLRGVPEALLRAVCLHAWPGNVRQLAQAMRRLALASGAGHWPSVEELLGEPLQPPPLEAGTASSVPPPLVPQAVGAASAPADRIAYRKPSSVDAQSLIDALEANDWALRPAALQLGVSRPSLYNLLSLHGIRRAEDLSREDIEAARVLVGSELARLASQLRTPREALRRRLRALGLQATDTGA